jgi:hypothetical protein
MATSYQTTQASFVKATIDGLNGAGKSGTAVRLAVGISKEYCNSAPVVAFDSEERYRFYKPTIFDVEGIPLLTVPGKSLVVLQEALACVESEGAEVFIGDQLTTPWLEGLKAFSYENGNLPFDRRQQLMNQWEPVVERFRYGKFHAICCGRLGYQWTNVEDPDTGDLKLTQGDSKFNAGGGNNFGYEADLELEMRRRKRSLMGLIRGKTAVEHVCDVIKDAAGGILNGQQFSFPSTQGTYKAGDYKPVLDAFRPYIDFMRRVPPPNKDKSSTRELLINGRTEWSHSNANRTGLLEDLDANLKMCFPGGEGKSKQHEMYRNLTLEGLNGFISWSRQADPDEVSTEQIERNLFIVRAMRKRIEAGEKPTDHNSLVGLLHLSTEDVLHPANGKTLVEVMTMGVKRGPQPIVKEMDDMREEFAG